MEILKQIKILEKRLFDMRTVGVSKKHCQDVQNEIDRLKGKYRGIKQCTKISKK